MPLLPLSSPHLSLISPCLPSLPLALPRLPLPFPRFPSASPSLCLASPPLPLAFPHLTLASAHFPLPYFASPCLPLTFPSPRLPPPAHVTLPSPLPPLYQLPRDTVCSSQLEMRPSSWLFPFSSLLIFDFVPFVHSLSLSFSCFPIIPFCMIFKLYYFLAFYFILFFWWWWFVFFFFFFFFVLCYAVLCYSYLSLFIMFHCLFNVHPLPSATDNINNHHHHKLKNKR